MKTTDAAKHHREVAAQALADAARFTPEDPVRATFIAEAQVHALIAVSEEQRTATVLQSTAIFALTDAQRLSLATRLGLV